ncbi:MAG TPA: hypothetical protein VGI11_19895 [Variovorax sp.]|jgi:hypothetical protein
MTSLTSSIRNDSLDTLDEAEWPEAFDDEDPPPPREWLFWSFFLCMAITALPLIGVRWTRPPTALTGSAIEDALLWALPAVAALPFLFVGCVGELALHPASRQPGAIAGFTASLAIGLAAAWTLLI